MIFQLSPEVIAEIKAEALKSICEEYKPLTATREQAAQMLGVQKRALNRIGLPVVQLPGQRDKYLIADIHAAIEAGRVK